MIGRILKYFGIFLSILGLIYISVSLTINFEGLYLKFNKQISDIGYEAKAASIDVSHFPIPTVTLGDVVIPGTFQAKKLTLKFSILSILTFNPSINSIEASDVNIDSSGASMIHHEIAIINMFKIFPHIPNIDLKKVLLADKQSALAENVELIKIRPTSNFNNITIHWNDKNYTNISYNKKSHLEVKISTVAPSHKIDFVETYDESLKLIAGTIDYNINNLKDYINDNYSDLDLLITQVASTEPIKITCDFGPEAKGIIIRNIKLISESLAMTGTADFFSDQRQDNINLHFTNINLTKLLKAPDMESVKLSKNKEDLKLKHLNSILNITADKILLSGFSISNAKLNASSDGTALNIKECTGSIQEEGKFAISGLVTQNQYRSKFDGKINISYPDANEMISKLGYNSPTSIAKSAITLTSDIIATPIDYKLTNLYTKIGPISATGSAALKLIGATPRLNLALNFSPINFDDKGHTIITPIYDYFKSLTIGMRDKDYLNKYIPIRKIGYLGNFDIILTNAIVAGDTIDKIHFICDASTGLLDFTSLYYQNGPDYLVGSGKLISTGLKPLINLRIKDGEIYTDDLSLEKIITTISNTNTKYSFDKVTLDFAIALRNLRAGKAEFKNFYVAAINQDQLFNISGLQGSYNSGGFTSSGSIFLDSMRLNLAYAYSNFNINDLNSFYPVNVFGIKDGWVSSNGTITTNGDTVAKFVYNLYTKSNFIASAVKWAGFDIDGLATATDNVNYNIANITADTNRFASTGIANIQKIAGGFEIERGIIKFSDITFNTPRLSGTALASYNIYNSNLDSNVKATFSLAPRDRFSGNTPVDVEIHTYGNIASPKKDINIDNIKYALDRKSQDNERSYNQNVMP